MPHIKTIHEANQALLPYVPLVSQLTGKDTTLERIRPLMALLDNPQDKIKIVHIAGTSGKTSTAYFMAGLLVQAGRKVGLTISPHVDSVTERVQLDGRPISKQKFCKYLGDFLDIVEQVPAKPSYFELLYALSFWVFLQEGVEYAVVETGMGGLHDATNIAQRADKVCIITDIGFDHMHILGNSLPEIAAQKAGIIHAHNPVIMFMQSADVMGVVESRVQQQGAELYATTESHEREQWANFPPAMSLFQQHNWLLAYAAYRFLAKRDALPSLSESQLAVTQALQVPARMDSRTVGDKTIIMDGAHNGQKMQTFLASFQKMYPDVKPAILLALKEGKEPQDVVPQLVPLASRIILTSFATSQDLPVQSMDPQKLADICRAFGAAAVVVEPDFDAAYKRLLDGPEPVVIVTGSFYLLSQLREKEHLQ